MTENQPRRVVLAPSHFVRLSFRDRLRVLVGVPVHVRNVVRVEPDRTVDLVVGSRWDVAVGMLPPLDAAVESAR